MLASLALGRLAPGTWRSVGFAPFSHKNGSLGPDCSCEQRGLCKHLLFLFPESGRGCVCDQLPGETLGTGSLASFPSRERDMCCHNVLLGDQVHPAGHPREGPPEAWTRFFWASLHSPLPFAGFALEAFAVINHRLSAVNPPSQAPTLRTVLGTPGKDGYSSCPHLPGAL